MPIELDLNFGDSSLDARNVEIENCYKTFTWPSENLKRELCDLVRSPERELWVVGKPGAGKTMFAKAIVGSFLKRDYNFLNCPDGVKYLPLYISLKPLSEKSFESLNEFNFSIISIILTELFGVYRELIKENFPKLRRFRDYNLLDICKNDYDTILSFEKLKKETRTEKVFGGSGDFGLKIFSLMAEKKETLAFSGTIDKYNALDLIFKCLIEELQKTYKILILIDDIDFAFKRKFSTDLIVNFTSQLVDSHKISVISFVYPMIFELLRESRLTDHKLQYNTIDLSISDEIFFDKIKSQEFFKSVLEKRLGIKANSYDDSENDVENDDEENMNEDSTALEEITKSNGFKLAIWGSMGNTRIFLNLAKQTNLDNNAIKKKLEDISWFNNYYGDVLKESIRCAYPNQDNLMVVENTIKEFYATFIRKMGEYRYEKKKKITTKIKTEMGQSFPLILEVDKKFMEIWKLPFLILQNCDYLKKIATIGSKDEFILPISIYNGNETFSSISLIDNIEPKKRKISDITETKLNKIFLRQTGGLNWVLNVASNTSKELLIFQVNDEIFSMKDKEKFEFLISHKLCPKCGSPRYLRKDGKYSQVCPECDYHFPD